MATVSVIIPTFNRQEVVGQAVQSVLAQTYTDYEVLVVDDGSTDDTEQVLHTWHSSIRYIKKANGGPASARNEGLRHASSDYVAFLDSDDLWEPTFLQTGMSFFSNNHDLGLFTTAHWVEPERLHRPRVKHARLEGDLYSLLFQKNFITTSAVLVKRGCFETIGGFNEKLEQAEDYDMWLRIARRYPMVFLNQPLCRWRSHSSNVSRHELQRRVCVQRVIQANYDPARISQKIWKLRQSRIWVSLGRAYLQQSYKTKAHQCFREAIRLTPLRFRPWRYFFQTWF